MSVIPVLIIDDDDVDRYLLKRQLNETALDVEVFEEANGKSALDFFNAHATNHIRNPDAFPPVFIFLDINMPTMDGFEFLHEFELLRKEADLSSSNVIVFSSSERKEDRDKALDYSFVKDYLVKGQFDSAFLKEKIEALL